MGKRAGAAGSGSPSKRSRPAGNADVLAKIGKIVAALEDESLQSEVPMGVRQMLARGAPAAMGTVVEERHTLQDVVMGHIREVFSDIASRLAAKVIAAKEASEAQADTVEAQRVQLQAVSAELEAAEKLCCDESEKLKGEEATLKDAQKEAAQVTSNQKTNAKHRSSVEKEKSMYAGIEEGTLKPLIEGGFATEKEAQKAINKLVKDLERIGAESAMLVSVPPVLRKKPEERKGFDDMVLDSVKGILKGALDAADAKLAPIDTEAQELEVEAKVKAEVVEKAQAARDSQRSTLQAAEAASAEKRAAKQAMQKTLASSQVQMTERNFSVCGEESARYSFDEVIPTLDFLSARSNAAPTTEEATAEKPAAALA